MLRRLCQRFAADENGAVTIDWVVLTAGLLTLGVVIAAFIINSSTSMSGSVGSSLADATVPGVTWTGQ